MRDIESVLLFSMPGIGDSLLATPALKQIKATYPTAKVTALTMFSGAAELLRACPSVDEVLLWDFPRQGLWRSLLFVLNLRRRRFDVSLFAYPANRLEYNVISLIVGARYRLGHRYSHLDFLCGNWLNNMTVHEDDALTNIEENLRLVQVLSGTPCGDCAPQLDLEMKHKLWAVQWIDARGLGDHFLVGFHAGGSTSKNHIHKRWPPEHFGRLGQILHREIDATILVFGGPQEDSLKNGIVEAVGPAAFSVEADDIMQMSALIASCGYFVSNDSALLHIARSAGVPTTGLFGPTNASWVRMPGRDCHEMLLGLPCQPCFYYSPRHLRCRAGDFRCLRDLLPEQIALEILKRISPSAEARKYAQV